MRNELRVGIMVFTGLALLVLLIYSLTSWGRFGSAYAFTLVFDEASGIQNGAEVRVSGVKVGQVDSLGLDPATNRALITVRVKKRVKLYTGYTYSIGVGGLIGEYFIDISPNSPPGELVKPGGRLHGTSVADMGTMISNANTVVTKLGTTIDALNAMFGDAETQRNMRYAVADLRKTTAASAQLAQTLNAVAAHNQGAVNSIVADMQSVAGDIRQVSDRLAPQLANSRVFANLDEASRNAVSITTRLDNIARTAESAFGDKALGADLQAAIANLRLASADLQQAMADARRAAAPLPEASSNLAKASADLPGITGPFKEIAPETASNVQQISENLRKTSESIGAAAQTVTKIGSALGSLQALQIEPEARLAFLANEPGQARSDFNVDLKTKTSMFRLGIADISNTSKFNAQFGSRFGENLWFRYGIVQSTFGIGADMHLNDRWHVSGDLFDPRHLRANLLVDYRLLRFGQGWWLGGGVYDLLGDAKLGVGVTYRPYSPEK